MQIKGTFFTLVSSLATFGHQQQLVPHPNNTFLMNNGVINKSVLILSLTKLKTVKWSENQNQLAKNLYTSKIIRM